MPDGTPWIVSSGGLAAHAGPGTGSLMCEKALSLLAKPELAQRSHLRLDLAPAPDALALARRFVRDSVAGALAPADVDRVDRLTDELVDLALLQGRKPFRVCVVRGCGLVMVAVEDDAVVLTAQLPYADVDVDRGDHPPLLVDSLADDHGVVMYDGGKTMWFTYRCPTAAEPPRP